MIHAGTLLAIPGQKPTSNQTIVIENGMITAVHDGFKTSQDLKLDKIEREKVDKLNPYPLL